MTAFSGAYAQLARMDAVEGTGIQVLWAAEHLPLPDFPPGVLIQTARNGHECVSHTRASAYDAVIARLPLDGWPAHELLDAIKRADPSAEVVFVLPEGDARDVARLMRLGAWYCLTGEPSPHEIAALLEQLAPQRRRHAAKDKNGDEPWRRFLVGTSRPLESVCETVRLVGPRRSTVLVTGETGTGKEMVARAIHEASDRSTHPFVAVNCSAIPEHLLEAELFGHVKGAFTGAIQQRIGRFEQANRGTIFFDEIGDMPLDLQAKLLRVLQEREFERVGSSETVRVDVRVIAATNVDLERRVEMGRFREDLFYRLNVVPIRTPPLRERKGDIPILVEHFLTKICASEQIERKQITSEALDGLRAGDWPGNVRQLENSIERAIALSGSRKTLYPPDFPLPSAAARILAAPLSPVVSVPDGGLDFEQTVSDIERSILKQALAKVAGNKKLAADMLRLKRTTLSAKLRSLEATA